MFQVLENGKPANHQSFPKVHPSWNKAEWETFEQAKIYAWKWLGDCAGGSNDGTDGVELKLNTPYDYSGYGDIIEIREI